MGSIRSCPACASERFSVLFEELGYPLVRCADCRFVFLGRLPTRTPEEKYARRCYRCPEKNLLFRKHLPRLAGLTSTDQPRLLDVGCASGHFLDMACSLFDVYGVELSHPASTAAAERHGERIRNCCLTDAQFPSRFFDVITYWDVLEHVYDIRSEIEEVARILKDDGTVVINVPSGAWHLARARMLRTVTTRFNTMTIPTHVNHFTVRTLSEFMGRFGFRAVNWRDPIGFPTLDRGPWNWTKHAWYALSVALHRLAGINVGFTILLYFQRR